MGSCDAAINKKHSDGMSSPMKKKIGKGGAFKNRFCFDGKKEKASKTKLMETSSDIFLRVRTQVLNVFRLVSNTNA